MTGLRGAASIVIGVLLASVETPAQTAQAAAGAINGRVIDATGAALPGVTVSLSSDALMGAGSAATNDEGLFRFPVVPTGEYTIAFALEGFETVSQSVVVTIGFTATVEARLQLAALIAVVNVERSAPVVDRDSTALTTSFNAFQLGNLPGARNMGTILSATPAVQMTRFDVGGSSELTGGYGAYGTFGQNRPTVEGINVGALLPYGVTLDFGSFEEVSVGTGAHNAEWPMPGVQTQFITKSGGNRYRATLYGDYENRNWQSSNIDDNQIARGVRGEELLTRDSNQMWSYRDLNADLGGYLKKDLIWWYSSFRDQDMSTRLVNFPVKPYRAHLSNFTLKTTYRLTERDKLIAFAFVGRNHQPNRLGNFGTSSSTPGSTLAVHNSEASTADQRAWGRIWKGEWNRTINDEWYLEARAGQFGADRPERPNGAGPRIEDIGNLNVRGGSRDWEETLRRDQAYGSVSYFHDGRSGQHLVKIGGEISRHLSSEAWRTGYPQDVLHILNNGNELDVYLFETPSRSEAGLRVHSAYLSDSWQLKAPVTLNLGLRFDRNRIFFPEQTHPAGRFNPIAQTFAAVDKVKAWNVVAPRVGAAIDLSGSGNTVAKFNYAWYWEAPGTFNANPNSNQWWQQFRWSDTNDNGTWDAGEELRPPVARRGGDSLESLDPDLELPWVQEVAAWFEHEFASDTGLRTGVVWRNDRQNFLRQNIRQPYEAFSVAIPVSDPGPDGATGTDDDGASVRAFQLDPTFVGSGVVNVVRNVPNAHSQYWTWEAAVTKRFSRRWSAVAGFVHTWYGDQAATYLGQTVRNNAYPLTPNDLINATATGQHRFRMWTAKIHGTFAGPWDLRITPYLRHQSGQPFGRTFVTTLNFAAVRILAEPIGTRRMDNVTIVDLRLEKGFRIGSVRRVAGFVDLFNLFNSNAVQHLVWASGPSFLRPLSIISPRIARVGAKLEW